MLNTVGPVSNSDGEEGRSCLTTSYIATFVSALVGGEVRGRVVICAIIILEGLNVSKANLQLESMCVFKLFWATMRTYHKKKITKNFNHYFWNFCIGGISDRVKCVVGGAIK